MDCILIAQLSILAIFLAVTCAGNESSLTSKYTSIASSTVCTIPFKTSSSLLQAVINNKKTKIRVYLKKSASFLKHGLSPLNGYDISLKLVAQVKHYYLYLD